MGLRIARKTATLEGHVAVEDAETLLEWLKKTPNASVRVDQVRHVHAAVLQVLLAARPRLRGTPDEQWLASVLAPPRQDPSDAGVSGSEIRSRDR